MLMRHVVENVSFLQEYKIWIEVICGSMFCGKTEELLRRLRRAKIANLNVIAFKAKVDDRYSKDKIVSHDRNSLESIAIDNAEDLMKLGHNYDVVGIDEAQFFNDSLLLACKNLANNRTRAVSYTHLRAHETS